MTTYYTLLTREHKNETWAIEFGDYDREVVDQERRDLRDGMSSGHQFKIISTKGDQKSINAAVAALNAALPLSAHAGDCDCAGCHIARIAS